MATEEARDGSSRRAPLGAGPRALPIAPALASEQARGHNRAMESRHQTGCLVCGAPLERFAAPRTLPCAVCGAERGADAACAAGHSVCDACHAGTANDWIERRAAATLDTDPVRLANDIMHSPLVAMHGPEHHFLVPAALLAAYHNARDARATKGEAAGFAARAAAIAKARARAEIVPGGFCGLQGTCGAAIGAGIFASVVTSATPLSRAEWGLANELSAEVLGAIAGLGGPRCCKRDVYVALGTARRFAAARLGVAMADDRPIVCEFAALNRECALTPCPYRARDAAPAPAP